MFPMLDSDVSAACDWSKNAFAANTRAASSSELVDLPVAADKDDKMCDASFGLSLLTNAWKVRKN